MKRSIDEISEDDKSNTKRVHGEIRQIGTHIYFYTDVDEASALDLITTLHEVSLDIQRQCFELEIDTYPPIHLHLNTCGGNLFEAFAIIDHIKSSKVPIVSIVEGSVASAGTLISVSCDKRYIRENAYMLIHELRSCGWGKYTYLKEDMDNNDDLMRKMIDIYVKNTNMTEDDLKHYLKKDRYWNAKKCLRKGLVDKIM